MGAKEEVVEYVVKKYSALYGADIIAGYRNGYFSSKDEESIALEIAEANPDILFVAISSPKKEIFISKYKPLIQTPFVIRELVGVLMS